LSLYNVISIIVAVAVAVAVAVVVSLNRFLSINYAILFKIKK
jgi:hypothetical protein